MPNFDAEGKIMTEDGLTTYSDAATLVRGAAALLESSMTGGGCSPPGGSAVFLSTLDSMLQNNQFCKESSILADGHAKYGDEAAASSVDGGAAPLPGGGFGYLQYGDSFTSSAPAEVIGPGINIVFEEFQPQLANPASTESHAVIATILAHEIEHIVSGHVGRNKLNEQAAYAFEAEIICCLIGELNGNPANADAIDALCERADVIQKRYCELGGVGPLANCCVDPDPSWAPAIPVLPPYDPIPRGPFGVGDLLGSSAGYSDPYGNWKMILDANGDDLYLSRVAGGNSNHWEYDLTSVIHGGFDAQAMVGGKPGSVFVAGRDTANGNGEIHKIEFGWSQGHPVLSVSLVYGGSGFEDIVSIDYSGPVNNSVTLFEWTNARLIGVDVMSGQLNVLADSTSYPELLEMASMRSQLSFSPTWEVEGITYSFQVPQDYDSLSFGSGRVELLLLDQGADGTIDQAVYSTP